MLSGEAVGTSERTRWSVVSFWVESGKTGTKMTFLRNSYFGGLGTLTVTVLYLILVSTLGSGFDDVSLPATKAAASVRSAAATVIIVRFILQ